jgi:hypothetical protein
MSGDLDPVRGRRPGASWIPVSHGLHRPQGSTSDLPAWRMVLPEMGRFTGLTAAGLMRWWMPPLPQGLPVFAAASYGDLRPQRAGLCVTRHRELAHAVEIDGLPSDPPSEVLLACARDLGLVDVVVLTDAALHRGDVTRKEIEATAAQRRRGAPRLRQALDFADARSESAWETLLRVLHVTCGVDVEPQVALYDDDGGLLGRVDLWVRGTNAVHEYDGEHHLTQQQQRVDLRRARRLGNDMWLRRAYTSNDVVNQAVSILRDADLSLGREHRPSRIRVWHRLLKESLYTSSGQERLRRKLNLAGPPRTVTGARSA